MTSPPPHASLPDDTAWHRLHPLSPLVRAGRQMVTIVVAVLLLFFASLLLRTAVAMLGFYLVARGSLERLVVCLAGFIVARFIVIWLTAAVGPRPQSAGGTNHAS